MSVVPLVCDLLQGRNADLKDKRSKKQKRKKQRNKDTTKDDPVENGDSCVNSDMYEPPASAEQQSHFLCDSINGTSSCDVDSFNIGIPEDRVEGELSAEICEGSAEHTDCGASGWEDYWAKHGEYLVWQGWVEKYPDYIGSDYMETSAVPCIAEVEIQTEEESQPGVVVSSTGHDVVGDSCQEGPGAGINTNLVRNTTYNKALEATMSQKCELSNSVVTDNVLDDRELARDVVTLMHSYCSEGDGARHGPENEGAELSEEISDRSYDDAWRDLWSEHYNEMYWYYYKQYQCWYGAGMLGNKDEVTLDTEGSRETTSDEHFLSGNHSMNCGTPSQCETNDKKNSAKANRMCAKDSIDSVHELSTRMQIGLDVSGGADDILLSTAHCTLSSDSKNQGGDGKCGKVCGISSDRLRTGEVADKPPSATAPESAPGVVSHSCEEPSDGGGQHSASGSSDNGSTKTTRRSAAETLPCQATREKGKELPWTGENPENSSYI